MYAFARFAKSWYGKPSVSKILSDEKALELMGKLSVNPRFVKTESPTGGIFFNRDDEAVTYLFKEKTP